MMFNRHDVSVTSISVIGWYSGGLRYLIVYLMLTLPFGLYQLFFLNHHFAGQYTWVYIASAISCILMTIGGFIPLRWEERYLSVNTVHEIVSVGSAVVFMMVILTTLILCARKSRHKVLFLSLCAIYPVVLLIGFMAFYTSALFQLSATLSFLVVLLVVNAVFVMLTERPGHSD